MHKPPDPLSQAIRVQKVTELIGQAKRLFLEDKVEEAQALFAEAAEIMYEIQMEYPATREFLAQRGYTHVRELDNEETQELAKYLYEYLKVIQDKSLKN